MSEMKPNPNVVERGGKICPICGKQSYSREGVHPQCSVTQADAPRKTLLAAEKKAKAEEKLRTPDKPD